MTNLTDIVPADKMPDLIEWLKWHRIAYRIIPAKNQRTRDEYRGAENIIERMLNDCERTERMMNCWLQKPQ